MPNKQNAKKALRQDRQKAVINKARKENVKSLIKLARRDIESAPEKAAASVAAAVKALDRAAAAKLLKKNTVARKKSRLLKRLNVKRSTPTNEKSPA